MVKETQAEKNMRVAKEQETVISTKEQFQVKMEELQKKEAEMEKLKAEYMQQYALGKKQAFEKAVKAVDQTVADAYSKYSAISAEIAAETTVLVEARKRADDIAAKINLLTISQQPYYKPVRDALTGKISDELLDEFLGKAPAVKKTSAEGEGRVRSAVVIDGIKMSWIQASEKYQIPLHEGANQRPYFEAGIKGKGVIYKTVNAATGEEITL